MSMYVWVLELSIPKVRNILPLSWLKSWCNYTTRTEWNCCDLCTWLKCNFGRYIDPHLAVLLLAIGGYCVRIIYLRSQLESEWLWKRSLSWQDTRNLRLQCQRKLRNSCQTLGITIRNHLMHLSVKNIIILIWKLGVYASLLLLVNGNSIATVH